MLDLVGSFAVSMMQPSNSPFGVRAVEWLRDNGAAWLVSDIENIYYSLNAPSTGGRRSSDYRKSVRRRHEVASYAPAPITPVISPALAGEGNGAGPDRWWAESRLCW